MKKALIVFLVIAMTICLAACGNNGGGSNGQDDANLGKYVCQSVMMDDLDLGTSGEWIELKADGKADLFLMDEADEVNWELDGENITLSVEGEELGSGTLVDGTMTIDILEIMTCTFVKE